MRPWQQTDVHSEVIAVPTLHVKVESLGYKQKYGNIAPLSVSSTLQKLKESFFNRFRVRTNNGGGKRGTSYSRSSEQTVTTQISIVRAARMLTLSPEVPSGKDLHKRFDREWLGPDSLS